MGLVFMDNLFSLDKQFEEEKLILVEGSRRSLTELLK